MLKVLIVGLLFFVIFNLFKALFIMNKNAMNKSTEQKMTTNLGFRLMLSFAVMILVVISLLMGWIQPNPRPY
ncbi:DUF2909 domain-containing protein [Catenovulum maritimum]|uniref:DUF2909 domain-containing protein n=1 Tax=Catenovulum maritimum TaxID=1513271 RepID=A0A0J8JIV7_9ALTE|nr:DUF2909 domain-containing protein [Catenovulum maritimum]KMT64391.1 hypothetical protein XM47_14515 [Catenovulum maritimum]